MTAKLINGKAIAEDIERELSAQVCELKRKGIVPRLAVILIGDNQASAIYVKKKQEACERVGIGSLVYDNSECVNCEWKLHTFLKSLNNDPSIHGILVQLPLPKNYNVHRVFDLIAPEKDVDVFSPVNVGLLVQGRPRFKPCTPHGIQVMLKRSGITVKGKHVVVCSRSDIVGKPLSSMLIQDNDEYANATVTVCHDKSDQEELKKICRTADIVVVAVGIPGFLKPEMLRPGAVVVDVGITRIGKKVLGDVDPGVWDVAGYCTPVPGGCGLLTVTMLLENTVQAARLQNNSCRGAYNTEWKDTYAKR